MALDFSGISSTSGPQWGPTAPSVSAYEGLPFAAFSRTDRLGRAADFTSSGSNRSQPYRGFASGQSNDQFAYRFDSADAGTFQLVDSSKARRTSTRRPWQRQRQQWQTRNNRGRQQPGTGEPSSQGRFTGQSSFGRRFDRLNRARRAGRRRDYRGNDRQPSTRVGANWVVRDQFELSQLSKLSAQVPEPEDLVWCGSLHRYDESYERISERNPRPLQRPRKDFFYVSTTDDPLLERLACEGQGNVFMTDAIMAFLMSASRTVYSWDLRVKRIGNSLFFDKRDDSQFDYQTVSETAFDPPPPEPEDPTVENKNSAERLAIEATTINQAFSQQILSETEKRDFENPHPFTDTSTGRAAAVAYRYRKWRLAGDVVLVARCELHAYAQRKGRTQLMTTYALNEWDGKQSSGIEWRGKVDMQPGAILATELKNNSAKLCRWTAQSVLAGADTMKVGFVSRLARTDNSRHNILGSQEYHPEKFAQQITLDMNNAWGTLRMLIDLFMEKPEGDYVLMRDANKPVVRVYEISNTETENDENA